MFYVIDSGTTPPWVLNLDGYARRTDATRAVSWQMAGDFGPPQRWKLATYDATRDAFVGEDGAAYEPGRGPYTAEAWDAFRARLRPSATPPEFTADDFADLAPYGVALTVERAGWTLSAVTIPDSDHGAPWEAEDGHGPVSDWRAMGSHGYAPKRPGEFVLCSERGGSSRFYDFADACKIARRDGWGVEHPEGLTPREVAAMAAAADFDSLRRWCADDWFYVGVEVTASRAGVKLGWAALWGIESDAGDYLAAVAADLAREALAEAVEAAQAVQP